MVCDVLPPDGNRAEALAFGADRLCAGPEAVAATGEEPSLDTWLRFANLERLAEATARGWTARILTTGRRLRLPRETRCRRPGRRIGTGEHAAGCEIAAEVVECQSVTA